jgi:predicted SAM-dependent methyltransferase
MIKLNLGCGNRKMHGFINVDARHEVQPDVIYNVAKIHEKFQDVDLIYASQVLEHFPTKSFPFQPITWEEVLLNWNKTLKDGGILRLSVPDLRAACEYYLHTNDFESVQAAFYGGQKYDFDFHYHGWTFDTLSKSLESSGFEDIHRYNWRRTEHFYVDDYSQSYLPHMDKKNGKLMSLNVQATKRIKK